MPEQKTFCYEVNGKEFVVREGFQNLIEAMRKDAYIAMSAVEYLAHGDTYTPQETALIAHLLKTSK